MLHVGKKQKKIALYAVLTFLIFGAGFSTFAQLSSDAYVVRTVHIFPSEITSRGWQNAETLTFQNLDEYSLLQEFNKINSATLGVNRRVMDESENNRVTPDDVETDEADSDQTDIPDASQSAEDADVVSTTETESEQPATDDSVTGQPAASTTDPFYAEDNGETQESADQEDPSVDDTDSPDPVAEAQEIDRSTEAEGDLNADSPESEVSESTEEETATTTVLREVKSLFAYAIETITETFSSTSSAEPDQETEISEELEKNESQGVTEDADVTFGFVTDIEVTELESNDEQAVTTTVPTLDNVNTTDSESNQSDDIPENSTADEIVESTDHSTTTESDLSLSNAATTTSTSTEFEETDFVTEFDLPASDDLSHEVSDCGDNCTGHILRLGNFGYPLDEGVEVSGAQLRLSFAAKHKLIRDTVPFLTMNYSFDDGETWSTGGSIVLDDEVSNSINGGYFLFALPAVDDSVALSNLQVELRYDDDPALLSDLYVDSVWLELFVLEPPEDVETPEFAALLADDGYIDTNLSGDRLVVSDTEIIDFDFTDDNTDETLIVKSSKKTYDGLSQTTTYFSVTNASDQSDDFTVQTYFPQNMGEVTDLAVFNLNKPKETIVPEYRPYVYHCEAGWAITDISAVTSGSLSDLSIGSILTTLDASSTVLTKASTTTNQEEVVFSTANTLSTPTEDISDPEVDNYMCGATNVIRTCDSLEGDGTACVITEKVKDHQVTQYVRGWESVGTNEGERSKGGMLRRASEFLGFGPHLKDVPDTFEGRVHTDGTFSVAPGETRYFKMDISYPAFSSGEYWIEVVGDKEYGLLDPFWSSLWRYRMPITIDNISGDELTDQQFFLELTASDSDFWDNVQENGNDIRFVRETEGNDLTWWDTNWEKRLQINIPAASVDEDLSNFPVYVDLNTLGSDFFTDVDSNGDDIRVVDDSGTPNEQAYELVSINTGGESGELHFRADSLSSTTDNVFYIYFGNVSASAYAADDPYGSEAVWSNSFDLRYAMDQDPSSSGPQLDSTDNGNDADSRSGMTAGDVVSGQVGEAINHDGNDGAIFDSSLPYNDEFTASMWWRSSGDGFAISRNSGATTKFGTWTGANMFTRVISSSDTSVAAPADAAWAHVVLTRDSSDKVDLYIDGVRSRLFGDVAQAGLSDWENVGGQTSQGFRGELDELRFADVKRSDGWITTEFSNQDDPSSFYATSTVESIIFSDFAELDHWAQHFSTTTQEADIWVQVDTLAAAASTTVHLYYGNATAVSVSDEYAPFTYNSLTDLYYVVEPFALGGTIEVYSLIDDNVVQLDSGATTSLNRGESASLSGFASTSVVRALGPISATIDDDATDSIVPISFATTTFVSPTERDTSQYYLYSPFAAASVQTYLGNSGTSDESFSIATSSPYTSTSDSTGEAVIIEASEPILAFHRTSSSDGDSFVLYPPTTRDIFGIHTGSIYISTLADDPDPDVYCSSLTTASVTGILRGDQTSETDCTAVPQGVGNAVRYTNATEPIVAIQQADSDGRETTAFWPQHEFGTRYFMTTDSAYAAVACSPRFGTSTVEVQTSVGSTVQSATCAPNGEFPGKAYFDNGSGGTSLAFTAGHQIVSTNDVPFYVIYEDDEEDNDETNILGSVQAKKYNSSYISYTIGVEEINSDAQYEQNNYRWYENTDGLTPSTSWPADDEATVAEGEPIAAGGAVNPGDVMRLRMNLLANNGTGTVDSTAFRLEYAEADTCSAVAESAWTQLAGIGSTTAGFAGYNNAIPADGDTLPSTLLSDSDVAASYEEQNVSAFLPNQVDLGEVVEFDWAITTVAPVVNSTYCFRMVRATNGALATHTVYPQLLTAGPPGATTLLTPFDNEHATSTSPFFTFVATDVGGDDLDYEIDIATDAAFSSIVESADSDSDPFDFENVTLISDKAPFNNGQVIRYLISSTLTNGQTYWWRVRAVDTDGSNTYGAYSDAGSFTIDTAGTVTEWFQTTDEQFDTNSLIGARTSGSDSVELDLAGSSLVGEYGSLDVNNGATTTVTFSNTYTDPVVVASIRYSRAVPNGDQPAVRVSGKTGLDFDVYADNYTFDAPGTSTIDWIVMEAGEWLLDDGSAGKRVFATSTSVTAIAGSNVPSDPAGLDITFPTAFSSAPAVFTMVTTINDPQWVVSSVYDGNNKNNPPTASQVSLYLNDNLASDGHGSAEDIDMIAFDVTSGDNNGVVFDVLNTATDVTHVPNTEPFGATFSSTPQVIVVQQLTMVGAQGSYAMVDIDTPPTTTNVTISAEEGGTGGARSHASERMSIVAFEDAAGDIIRAGSGQITSSVIDYDDGTVGNAWGEISWNDSGDVTHRVQYNTGSGFQNIPDAVLTGNDAGFTTSPINILALDTNIYNEIRLVAEFAGVDPELFDWTVTWGQRVEVPELGDPYDNEKTGDTTPTFDFSAVDPQGDSLDYEISYSTDPTFESSSTTIRSDLLFTDFNGGTAGPYVSGATVTYTIPGGSALTDGQTYWWRVRAKDPAPGNDSFSPWSEADNFTVDTGVAVSTWFQTTQAQFQQGVIDGVVASTSNSVELSNEVAEYGSVELTNNTWTTVTTDLRYNDMVVIASPTYDFDQALDNGRTPQIRNKTRTSFDIKVENATLSLNATTSVQYLAIEAGDWIVEDGGVGTRIVAGTAADVSNIRGSNAGYTGGTVIDFVPDFSAPPAVFATVSADDFPNGSKWVATVLDDGTQAGEVTAAEMNISLGIGYDTDTVRAAEDIDYVAVDVSTGDNNGTLFDSFNSGSTVTHNDIAVAFNQTFSTLPGTILTHNNATAGGDGGFSQVDTGTAGDSSQVYLSVAEIPANGNHAAEIVSVLAFESTDGTILRDQSVSGGLSGSIASEPVLFTDGFGPKFERAVIGSTTPGASEMLIQLEYQTATGSWALIPDGDLPGNSTGFSTETINLTGINPAIYETIRLVATLSCDGVDCPTLDDWAVEWSEGVTMSGTLQEFDRLTSVANATVTVSVNGAAPTRTGQVTAGSWMITNVTAFVGDVVTVFVDGLLAADVPEDEEAVAVFVYDGLGDMTGVELYENHLSFSSDELSNVTLAKLEMSDNSAIGDEDVFFDIDGSGNLDVCAVGNCLNASLYVGPDNSFVPATSSSLTINTHDFVNEGTVEFDANTMEVSGSWLNNATTSLDTSTVIFTATSSTETLNDTDGLLDFHDLIFGQTSGTATWTPQTLLDIAGDLSVDYGTLDRDTQPIAIAGGLATGVAGFWNGAGTTTFDGTGSDTWSDANPVLQDIGSVVIDGASRSVLISSDVRATEIIIEANDTLNAGGANDIFISGDFTNNNVFSAQSSQLVVDGAGVDSVVTTGGSNLYAFRASTTNGSVAFTESAVTLLNNFSIATGTVTMPTSVLNIAGSFTNEGGDFAHNNSEVNFTGSGNKTITLLGDTFLNSLYDVRFSGNGDWIFLDTNATTTNTWTQTNGSVTLPSGTLTVGRNFLTSGSGNFDANNGEVIFLARSSDTLTTNSSSLYDVRIREGDPVRGGDFDLAWVYRDVITIQSAEVGDDLTDFPVYVDLADFDPEFFNFVNADGGDIRVTLDDGLSEVPREIVDIDTGADTGEMYFKAPTLSSTTNTTFYVYYGNALASDYAIDDTYGAENVWDDDFLAVYHMENEDAVDSTSFDRDATAVGDTPTTATGRLGTAVSIIDNGGDDYLNLNSDLPELDGGSEMTLSTWVNVTDDAGDDVIFSTGNSSPILWWDNIGGTTNNDTYTFSVGSTAAGNRVDAAPTGISTGDTWQYVNAAMQSSNRYIYVDGVLRNTKASAVATIPVNTGNGAFIGRWLTSFDFGGLVDEFRISQIERSAEWVAAEFSNMDTPNSFYVVTPGVGTPTRIFADTNTTIANDIVIESAQAQLPSGDLFVGGSFDNNSAFSHGNGTVVFNATTSGHTVAASSSSFYDLTFDGVGGEWTVTENATATNAIELSNGNNFTLDSGLVLESAGTFFTQLPNASTTWVGSTLRLSGSDHEINDKSSDGETFGTLAVVGDTDIKMWNSNASSYTTNDSASIYSQDHAAVNGDLYIFGDYSRESGTEYWNYAIDFDGTSLLGGGERAADVRISDGGSVVITNADLEILGNASASTTVDAQSGTYTMQLNTADLAGEYFTMTGGDASGLQLLASTTLSTFANSEFTIPAVSAAISVGSTTIDANPAAQYFNIDFVTGGGSTNVNLLDAPNSFWWFRDGVGDRYGEAFDNNDADPGAIRWDDSNYQIDISGVAYASDKTTPLGGPTCDGVATNVRVVVDGGLYTDAVSCDGVTGAFNFSNVSYAGDAILHVYLDTAGGSNGAVVTKTPTVNITDLDIYANHTIVRHELTAPIAISELAVYDNSDDTDLPFSAATGTTHSLLGDSNTGLYIWPGKTFVPAGVVTLQGNANANTYEGTLELGATSTFTGASTTVYTLAGSLISAAGAAIETASSTFVFNATTTGKVINVADTIDFYEAQFTGVGGSWSLDSSVTAMSDVLVSDGTLQGTADLTLYNGELTGDGTVDMTGGLVTVHETNTLGGVNPWSFYDLTLGNGLVAGVTTPASNATTTVRNVFTIAAAHFYDAGASVVDLTGNGDVLVENGTFLEDMSTVQYSGATPNVLATSYYDLVIDDPVTLVAAIAPSIGLQIFNDLTIGQQGTASLNLTTNDPLTSVAGDLIIATGGTLFGSDVAALQVFGDWLNSGTYTSNAGVVSFNSSDAATIDAGSSNFAQALFTGDGPYTMVANATATVEFNLANNTSYTQQTGTVLAVGGQFINETTGVSTTWTDSILSLYGGQSYQVNSKTTDDDYAIVSIDSNTHPRLWNSSFATVTTAVNASLYSMDNDDVAGDLYIYGDYINSSFADSWSYGYDFDGVSGSDRQANVYIEGGGSVNYTSGSLAVIGTSTASTTLQSFAAGTYDLTVAGTASTTWLYATPRDLGSAGISFSGTPNVHDFSFLDLLVETNAASAVTVAGTVIDANPAKNFTTDYFNFDTGVTGAVNVTASGASVSSWRFTNNEGNLDGEGFDVDSGDPGEIVWEDSAQEVTIAGNVYSDEGSTVSGVCDGATNNVLLRVAGLTTYTTSCNAVTGAYSIPAVAFSANDTLTLYISGETEQAANISIDPVSNISNMDLYEDRVIVRHEGASPITIADMAVWDSADDGDIPFTAVTGGTDTLTLPSAIKLIVWNDKTFAPDGDVTIGDSLELFAGADYLAADTETHTIGASLISGIGAIIDAAESEFVFTSTAGGQTIDLNEQPLHQVSFTGSGAWTITDPNFTAGADVVITDGDVTLPTGTTTVTGSFDNTGGSFDANAGLLYFNASTIGQTIEFGGSDANTVLFDGVGAWTFADATATATDSFIVATGSVSLPTVMLVVGEDFVVNDTITHGGGTVQVVGVTGGNVVTLGGNDLGSLIVSAPAGDYTLTDVSAALLGDLTLTAGSFTVGTGTVSIGGSFDVSGGTYANGSGTLLFNSTDGGEFIDPGTNDLYNVVIAGAGGWSVADHATTTNNFSLTNASTFSLNSGSRLYVGGVFSNSVGGAATTWTGTTLVLDGGNEYEVNTKSTPVETYNNLVLGENTDVSMWNSSALSVDVPNTSSLYSQDHAVTDGALYIYGDYHIGTTSEYWSTETDFDGAVLGAGRAVTVSIASSSIITVDGGSLEIIGTLAASTTIKNQGVNNFTFIANDGTLNANYYNITDLDVDGLQLYGSVSVPSLSNGYFTQAVNNANLITLVSAVINNNASRAIVDTGFQTNGFTGGVNVTLDATTTNSWSFTGMLGDLWGENFDFDGLDDCSSIRWDDSSCLLTEQTNYRWRNDDGGEGAPDSSWYDTDWSNRQRLRIVNNDAMAYASTAVKFTVTYDSDMQTDFEDLRFTASDGTTLVNHWIEKVSTAASAVVWVEAPALPANSVSEFYMYYGNVVASDASDGDSVFEVFEDFEDDGMSEYAGSAGDLALFSTNSTFAYGGGFGLDTDGNESGRTTNGITRDDVTTEQGQSIRFMQYVDTADGSGDEVCTIFASNGVPADHENYAVCIDQVGTDRVSIAEDINDTENSGSILGTADFSSLSSGWYEILIDWETDDTIDVVVVEDSSGTVVATTTATDATYTTGGIGFAYWFQNGGWDSFVAWPRTETVPTVYLGAEQSDGGATWAGLQNTPTGGFAFGDTARLRVSVENSGLAIVNQQLLLEYAPKLTAPSCEAVAGGDYSAVPNAASCGASAVCMTTSSDVSDGDTTTDHLVTEAGDFVAGKVVTSPSSKTANYDLAQDYYTELEYALQLTINATNDSYCFRVTDDGSTLDSYSNLPELTLSFDPTVTGVTLNDGLDIVVIPGATTTIVASSTVTDFNGIADLASATTTFYKTSAGAACTPNDNNCYIATSSCSYVNCAGNSCSLLCTAPFAFHADPTDADGAEEWFAFMEVSDQGGALAFDTSIGIELLTMRALDVQNSIAYGTVDINEDTGPFNPAVSLVNIGNEAIDVTIGGTDMTDGGASVIAASYQRFSTSTFVYNSCVTCHTLTQVGADIEVDLDKPLLSTHAVSDSVYWGIEVPFGTNSAPHTGINSFTAISD